MRRHFYPGGSYIDALPSGERCVLFPNSHIQTHLGSIPLPPGEAYGVLYLRCTNANGFKFAGQAHDRNDVNWEWFGGWQERPTTYLGVSPVIYDRVGHLHMNDGSWGSQGARYVAPDGRIVTADETYYSPVLQLSEWTEIAPQLYIGQSHPDGTNDSAWAWDRGTLRKLETGPCRFIRANRDGEAVTIAFVKRDGAVSYDITLDELRALPLVSTPAPTPPPPPQPTPEPPAMNLPDPGAVKAALQRERDKYPAIVDDDQCGAIINAAARQFPHVGMHRKTSGSHATLPNGEKVNRNVMRYLPPGDDKGWWADVLGAAGSGIATPLAPDWERSTDGRESFVPPVGAVEPEPEPEPEPQPEPPDLPARVAALETRMAKYDAWLRGAPR